MDSQWVQPPENTLESLKHAIQFNDGVEFDLRLTSDGALIVHHDSKLAIPPTDHPHSYSWTENHTLDELTSFGFLSFQQMLDDSTIASQWRDQGKMGCIEFKRPHPKALYGGGYFGHQRHVQHVANMVKKADLLLEEHEIPSHNTVYYAFNRGMEASIRDAQTSRPWAELKPYMPPFGNYYSKRVRGGLQFLFTPLSSLIHLHRKAGASMVPCAVDYFVPPKNYIPLGRSGGLSGKPAQRFRKHQRGIPIYVWPTSLKIEHSILEAGLTGLTDCSDPSTTWLPSGHARWNQPACLPLDTSQKAVLKGASKDDHLDVLRELHDVAIPWLECDAARRKQLVEEWRKQWSWEATTDAILDGLNAASPPWQAVRLIGHRGSGKTPRPVLTPHSM